MRQLNFDMEALRTFCVGLELGSFAKAAGYLCRSTSAVSAQLKKLEEQVGTPILRKSGRGLIPTEAGEQLLGYARRILELNDEAWMSLGGLNLKGKVRLGLQEDFSEHLLAEILGRFTRANTSVIVESKVARNAELHSLIQSADIDLALAWHVEKSTPHMEMLGSHPLAWIGPAGTSLLHWAERQEPVPLVTFDVGCAIRNMATDALDHAGIAWRIAFTSHSLGSVWGAVAAGLGITARTHFGMPAGVRIIPEAEYALPILPSIDLALHRASAQLSPAAQRMHTIIREALTP